MWSTRWSFRAHDERERKEVDTIFFFGECRMSGVDEIKIKLNREERPVWWQNSI